MDTNDIEQLKKLVNSPIINVVRDTNTTIIEFENGVVLPLYGGSFPVELDVPTCFMCGQPGGENPLFTTDDKKFLCKDCTILAVETFLKNGVEMDINITESFKDVGEQINKLSKNLEDIKSGS